MARKDDMSTRRAAGIQRPGARILIGFIAVSVTGIVALVGFLLFRAVQPADITFADNRLTLSGLYGQQIPAAELQVVELTDTLPKILRRTNGSALGNQLGGHFTMEGIGAVMLYLDKSRPPFIYIETANRKIYLNLDTPEETRRLYEQLKAAR